jgi:hypothetical protein
VNLARHEDKETGEKLWKWLVEKTALVGVEQEWRDDNQMPSPHRVGSYSLGIVITKDRAYRNIHRKKEIIYRVGSSYVNHSNVKKIDRVEDGEARRKTTETEIGRDIIEIQLVRFGSVHIRILIHGSSRRNRCGGVIRSFPPSPLRRPNMDASVEWRWIGPPYGVGRRWELGSRSNAARAPGIR